MGGCLSADIVVDPERLEELRKQSSLAQRQGSVSSSRRAGAGGGGPARQASRSSSRRSSGSRPHRSHDGGSDGEAGGGGGGRGLSPAGPSRVVLMDGDDTDAAAAAVEEEVMYLIKQNGGSAPDGKHHNNRYGGAGGDSRQQNSGGAGTRASGNSHDTDPRWRRGSNGAAKAAEGGWVHLSPHNTEAEVAARLGLVGAGTAAGGGAQDDGPGAASPVSSRADVPACRALSYTTASGGGRVIHGSFSGVRYAGPAPDAALAARPVAGGSGSGATGERRRRCSIGEMSAGGPPATLFKATSSFSSRHRRGSNDPLGAALLIMRGAGGNAVSSDSRPRMAGNSASGGAASANSTGGAAPSRPPRYSSLQQQPSLHGYGAALDTARPEQSQQQGEAGQGPRRLDVPAVRQLQRGGERQWQSFSAYGGAAAARNAGARAPLQSNPQVLLGAGSASGGRPQVRPEDSSRRREPEPDIEVACDPPPGALTGRTVVGGLAPLNSDSEGEADVSGANAGTGADATSGSESGGSSAALGRPRAAALAGGPSRNANSLPGAVQDGSNAPLELLNAATIRAQRQQQRQQQRHGKDGAASGLGQRPPGHLADEVWRTADGQESVRHPPVHAGARASEEGDEEARRRTSSQLSTDDEEIAAIARAAANELAKNRSYRHTGDVFEDQQEDEAATELVEPGSGLAHRARRGSVEERRQQRHVFSEREQRRTQRDRRDRQEEEDEEKAREREEQEPRRPARHVIRPHVEEGQEEADGAASGKGRSRRRTREEQRRREEEEDKEEEAERRRQEERERTEAEVLEAVSRTASQRWQTARTLQPSRSILKKPASVNRRASEAASVGTDTEPDSQVASLSLDGGELHRAGAKSRMAPGETAASRAPSHAALDQASSGHGPASGAHESTAVEALDDSTECGRGRSREPGGDGGKRPRSLSKSVSFRGVDGDGEGDTDGGKQLDDARTKGAAAAARTAP